MKLSRLKITVERIFSPKEVFGHEMKQASNGETIPPCRFFEVGQEFVAENSFTRPEEFCGWAWRDLTVRLTKFDLIDDMDWPEKDITYVACGDGVRPVIFKLERIDD
ncbi:MAG: TIGR04076 family protein [Candidatus Thorarchaeota archaeon]